MFYQTKDNRILISEERILLKSDSKFSSKSGRLQLS